MKITLTELHVGACSTVVAIAIDGKELAAEFLDRLRKSRLNDAKKFHTTFSTICSVEHYSNKEKFKNLGDGIYEIKINGLRLYCFKDTSGDFRVVTESSNHLILACNGGTKNTQREQQRDIKKAQDIRTQYFNAKKNEASEFEYNQIENEN